MENEPIEGIYTTVVVKCNDTTQKYPFQKVFNFPLPRNVLDASTSLREKIYINRAYDIEDVHCEKYVEFKLKKKPSLGFALILKGLEKAGIPYKIIKQYEGEK